MSCEKSGARTCTNIYTQNVPWTYLGAQMWPLIEASADEIRQMEVMIVEDKGNDTDSPEWIGFTTGLTLHRIADIATPHGYIVHACEDGIMIIPLAIQSRAFLKHVAEKFHDLYDFGKISSSLVLNLLAPAAEALQEDMTDREKELLDDAVWNAYFKAHRMLYRSHIGR